MTQTVTAGAVYLFVADRAKTIDLFQLLGFEVERVDPMFAGTNRANGVTIEQDPLQV